MTLPRLVGLTINNLRGCSGTFTLPFQKSRPLTIVYGENGSGKSTLCDALDFLGNGNIGSLAGMGLRNTHKYWGCVHTGGTVSVSLETAIGRCDATLVKKDVLVPDTTHQPRVQVLRRKQILKLIEAKEGERYEAVKNFIDVTAIEQSEANLNSLIGDRKKVVKELPRAVSENEEALSSHWRTAESPQPSAIDEIRDIAQLRNVMGAHFNENAFELLDADAVRFGTLTVTLLEALSDPDEGWPMWDHSGSYWATRGETRRLYPLAKPH